MRPLRFILDRMAPLFGKGKPLERLYPVYEVVDTFFYTPGETADGSCHVRDGMDYKRMMSIVLLALVPCVLMACYNTGLQAHRVLAARSTSAAEAGAAGDRSNAGEAAHRGEAQTRQTAAPLGWRSAVLFRLGASHDPNSLWANFLLGALYFGPVYLVTMAVGLGWEILFAVMRRHEVNEGFFVTGLLFPLTLPPGIPWWQVAVGISFGVVFAKELFGGTGRNFLNPALAARAFLFFAYPGQISGNAVWVAADGFSGATPLSAGAAGGMAAVTAQTGWLDAFIGTIPGSMGETSTLACLFGALVLVVTGIGSWRIMTGMLIGAMALASLFFAVGSETNAMFSMPPHWHLVTGGLAFGLVFMATDPVTAAMTSTGQWIYSVLIGAMVVLIRVVNPAFPEGTMLAILFGNVTAPLIDHYVVQAHLRRRAVRHA